MTLNAVREKIADFINPYNEKDTTEFRKIAMGYYNRGKITQHNYAAMLEKYTGWIYAAIRTITADIASADLQLLQSDGNTDIEITKHPFLDFWKHPNPEFTRRFLVRLQQIYYELCGQAYWYFIVNGLNKPVEVWSVAPPNIKPRTDDNGKVVDYEYQPIKTGNKVYIPKEFILHEKDPNPMNPVMGYSTIFAANDPIFQMDKMNVYNGRLFLRMARPDVILRTKNGENLTDSSRKRIAQSWIDAHGGGADNAFNQPAVLEGGLEAQLFSVTPKDLEFTEGYKMVLEQLIACYGVTLDMLGITKDVNKANAFALELSYQRNTVMPKLNDKAEWLTQFVLHRYYDATDNMRCEYKSTIPVDREVKLKEHKGLVTSGIETPNEARKAYHLAPDKDGDTRLVPLNMVGSGSAVTGQGRPSSAPVTPPKEKSIVSLNTKIIRLNYWEKIVNRRLLYEQQYRNTLKKIFKKLEKQTIAIINDLYKKGLKGVEWLTPPEDIFKEEIDAVSRLFIKQAIVNGGKNIVIDFNLPISFEVDSDMLNMYLEARTNLLRNATDQTYKHLKRILQEGVDEGLSTTQMAAKIREDFPDISEFQSKRISRTEINSAENEGYQQAMIQANTGRKMWITAGDEKVRDSHIDLDGEITLVNDVFSNGLMYPSEPNCRCAIAPAE